MDKTPSMQYDTYESIKHFLTCLLNTSVHVNHQVSKLYGKH